MKEYELWIDESGDFRPRSQVRKGYFPSLVGGILIEKGKFTDEELRDLVSGGYIDPMTAHEKDFTPEMKRAISLPALEAICKRGGKLVYFENRERLSHYSNKELYLRLLAGGLMQLIQLLAARDGEFVLDIEIAQRGVPLEDLQYDERPDRADRGYRTVLIEDRDYLKTFKAYFLEQWQNRRFVISDRCHVNFSVMDARLEIRLKLADYADNSRITRNSEAFSGAFGNRLKALFDDDYIFSVTVNTSENIIRTALAEENLAAALRELYMGHGDIDHDAMFGEIVRHFENISFRLGRIQLNNFVNTLIVYARNETDFEQVEAVLKAVLGELFPVFEERGIGIQADAGEFWTRLCLSDMYLREGDLASAGSELDRLEAVIRHMNYRIENLKPLYFYIDKRALYEINCMDYRAAEKTITESIDTLEMLLDVIGAEEDTGRFFDGHSQIHSEYLGNALTMRIYSKMFQQRRDHSIYDSLIQDSDLALSQYEFEGELERNQQYRAHIEMVQGNYTEALRWLLRTRNLELETEKDIEPFAEIYLDEAVTEDPLSRTYYLMYYVEIMCEAARSGQISISGSMVDALWKNDDMMAMLSGRREITDLHSDSGRKPQIFIDITQAALNDRTVLYHPIEVVWWKYGAYLYMTGRRKEAREYFTKAENQCSDSEYLTMRITGLGIRLEEISLMMSYRLRAAKGEKTEIKSRTEAAGKLSSLQRICGKFSRMKLPEKIADYVGSVKAFAENAKKIGICDMKMADEAMELSRYIGY